MPALSAVARGFAEPAVFAGIGAGELTNGRVPGGSAIGRAGFVEGGGRVSKGLAAGLAPETAVGPGVADRIGVGLPAESGSVCGAVGLFSGGAWRVSPEPFLPELALSGAGPLAMFCDGVCSSGAEGPTTAEFRFVSPGDGDWPVGEDGLLGCDVPASCIGGKTQELWGDAGEDSRASGMESCPSDAAFSSLQVTLATRGSRPPDTVAGWRSGECVSWFWGGCDTRKLLSTPAACGERGTALSSGGSGAGVAWSLELGGGGKV